MYVSKTCCNYSCNYYFSDSELQLLTDVELFSHLSMPGFVFQPKNKIK